MADLNDQQKKWIDEMIKKSGLNKYGDKKDTVYAGGTPLFNERTGKRRSRYDYIRERHPDWLPKKND